MLSLAGGIVETAELGRSSTKTVRVEERASERDMAREVKEELRRGSQYMFAKNRCLDWVGKLMGKLRSVMRLLLNPGSVPPHDN